MTEKFLANMFSRIGMEFSKVHAPAQTSDRKACHDSKEQDTGATDGSQIHLRLDFIKRAFHDQRIKRIEKICRK
ncbi:hypothetical protein D3C87_1738740 [compost metagenome]